MGNLSCVFLRNVIKVNITSLSKKCSAFFFGQWLFSDQKSEGFLLERGAFPVVKLFLPLFLFHPIAFFLKYIIIYDKEGEWIWGIKMQRNS